MTTTSPTAPAVPSRSFEIDDDPYAAVRVKYFQGMPDRAFPALNEFLTALPAHRRVEHLHVSDFRAGVIISVIISPPRQLSREDF